MPFAVLVEHLAFREHETSRTGCGRHRGSCRPGGSRPPCRPCASAHWPKALPPSGAGGCSSRRTSSAVPELLDEATLLRALRLVGEKLARQGKRAEIYIFGRSEE